VPSKVQGTTVNVGGDWYGNGTFSKGSASPSRQFLDELPSSEGLWYTYVLAVLRGDEDVYGTSLGVSKTFEQNGPPDLVAVTTPLDDAASGDREIVSPYMPNPCTDQTASGINGVPTDRTGQNGSIESPSVAALSQITNYSHFDWSVPPTTFDHHPSYVLGSWKKTSS